MHLLIRLKTFLFPQFNDSDALNRQIRSLLILMSVLSLLSFQMWRALFNNYAVEVAGIDAAQMGIIQSVREIPGFLALLVIFALYLIKEQYLAILSLLILGFGVLMTGFFESFSGVLLATFIMSVGFHYFETLNQSLTLQHIPSSETPKFLAMVRSMSSLSGIFGVFLVYILIRFFDYKTIFFISGSIIIVGVIYSFVKYPLFQPKVIQHKKMILRKKYWLFYVLTFLSGARRQIIVAFAVFLMVKQFEFTVQTITVLFIVNQITNMFWAPFIAKMIDSLGERIVISIEYGGLIFVFLGYAFTQSAMVLIGLYILDHLFFNMSIAIRTYFQKIADPADIAGSMAVGFTINHIAAVIIPFTGGLIWMFDYRYTFFFGVLLAVTSLIMAQFISLPKPKK